MALLEFRRNLGSYDFLVFSVDRNHPPGYVRVGNPNGSTARFQIGGAPLATVPYTTLNPRTTYDLFADPVPVVLAGTVTVTKGSQQVVGVATAFTTTLNPGDVVALADGLVLGRVNAVPTDDTHFSLSAPWAGKTQSGVPMYIATPYPKTIAPGEIQSFNLPIGGVSNRFIVIVRSIELPIGFNAMGGDQTQFTILQDGKTQVQLGDAIIGTPLN